MRLGICTSPDGAAKAKQLGFDYVEVGASSVAAMSEEEFAAAAKLIADSGLEAEAANGLVPKSVPSDGPDFDPEKVRAYAEALMPRLSLLGVKSAVYGSSGSRNVPPDYPMELAFNELVESARIIADAAKKFGITIVAEPLCTAESNIINTVGDGAEWAEEVDRPNFRILADYYHMGQNGEGYANLVAYGPWLRHIHIAHPSTRGVPRPGDGGDYEGFFAALREAGYDSRVSFEGRIADYDKEIPVMVKYLRGLISE